MIFQSSKYKICHRDPCQNSRDNLRRVWLELLFLDEGNPNLGDMPLQICHDAEGKSAKMRKGNWSKLRPKMMQTLDTFTWYYIF